MADPFVAEIRIFPFNFAPRGWAFCNGQLMPISQNTALFSLLGTTYGGDGKSTFALPNIQGRAPMHPGQGPGLSLHDLGETGGSDTVTLQQSEMPAHNHAMGAQTAPLGAVAAPAGATLGRPATGGLYVTGANPALVTMSPSVLAAAGGGLPHNNLQPYLTLNFCIAQQGVFPARS
jgi:microcystin-dependent protein